MVVSVNSLRLRGTSFLIKVTSVRAIRLSPRLGALLQIAETELRQKVSEASNSYSFVESVQSCGSQQVN